MDFSETESPTTTSTVPASSGLSTSSAPTATHTPFTGFSLPDVLITIDNNTIYQLLPGQQSINTILSDGTVANITDQAIELGSTSVSIPNTIDLMLNGGRETQQLGPWTVEFSMREFQKVTSSCLSGKFTCFKQAAQSFIDSAGTLAASLGKVGASMLQDGFCDAWDAAGLAAEASPYATTAESMSEGIGSLLNSLEGSVEGLDGAMSMVNGDLSSFEEYEMEEFGNIEDNVFPAYPTLRPTISSLKNLNNILQLAIKNPTGTLLTIAKNQYVQLTTGLGLVSLSTYGLEQIKSADLNRTDTPSNGTADPQDTRTTFIKFVPYFPLLLFNVLTKTLDGDAGVKTSATPLVNDLGPGYTTEVVVGSARLMKYLPFISFVYIHPTYEQMQVLQRVLPDMMLAELRNPETYVVPNRLTLTRVPGNIQAPEDLTDYVDHGTGMAAAAAGAQYGIASKANLYLIKAFNAKRVNNQWVQSVATPDALNDALSHVLNIVRDRNLQGKAVVSFSQSYQKYNAGRATKHGLDDAARQYWVDTSTAYDNLFARFFTGAKTSGVIFVTSAGNNDVGASDNEIITVGAVYQDGTLWEGGSPQGVHVGTPSRFVQDPNDPLLSNYPDARLGWLDIYAPGFRVESGLVAYFLALPENSDRFTWSVDKNNAIPWGLRMKQYMTTLSYQWNDAPGGGLRPGMPPLKFNPPSQVNVAYNGAYGPMNNVTDVATFNLVLDVNAINHDHHAIIHRDDADHDSISVYSNFPDHLVNHHNRHAFIYQDHADYDSLTVYSIFTEHFVIYHNHNDPGNVKPYGNRRADASRNLAWSCDCTGEHNNLSLLGQTFDYEGWGQDCHNVNYTDLDPAFTNLMSWRIYNGNCTFYDVSDCWDEGHNLTYYASEGCRPPYAQGLTYVGGWVSIKCMALLDPDLSPTATTCHIRLVYILCRVRDPTLLLHLLLQGGEVRVHSIRDKLTPRDLRILLLRPLDERVLAGLVEEGDRIPLPVVVTRLARRLDPVERRLEAVVRPAHEHVSDVADDSAGLIPDLRPGVAERKLGHRLAAGTDLQPALSFTLEQQCQQTPVSMGAGPMPDRAVVGLRRRKVAKQAEDILALRAPGEADYQLVGDALDAVHEVQAVVLEARQEGVVHPHVLVAVGALAAREHVLAELELVGLLHVGRAGGGPELGIPLPADVLGVPGHCGLDVVRDGEEGLGGGEGLVYFGLGDAMVDDGEEPDLLGGVT
ncbi:Subtilisin-like protease 2 [Cytospora mali]|uniref:Subtilisin-like protease 2 n=1 Tax=Cytospora mali TaxID=578113 RepID=A0A194US24_CYTMA|nr:Subtilisin-like protease 2 [Valsa mali var. pyri (nom. inval.)]